MTQFYLQLHHACLSFISVHRMAPPLTEVRDIQLQLTTHLSTPKRWKAEMACMVGWPIAVYPHKWSPVSYRSSAGQGKFAGQRPTFYHCATQPTRHTNRERPRYSFCRNRPHICYACDPTQKQRKKKRRCSGKLGIGPDHPRRRIKIKFCMEIVYRSNTVVSKCHQNWLSGFRDVGGYSPSSLLSPSLTNLASPSYTSVRPPSPTRV